jgi:hypothetical protein
MADPSSRERGRLQRLNRTCLTNISTISQINPVHTTLFYLSKINVTVIHPHRNYYYSRFYFKTF